MTDEMQIMHDLSEVKAGLAGLRGEVRGLAARIDDALVSQIADHGLRLTRLENWRVWLVGVAVGGSAVCSIVFAAMAKIMGH